MEISVDRGEITGLTISRTSGGKASFLNAEFALKSNGKSYIFSNMDNYSDLSDSESLSDGDMVLVAHQNDKTENGKIKVLSIKDIQTGQQFDSEKTTAITAIIALPMPIVGAGLAFIKARNIDTMTILGVILVLLVLLVPVIIAEYLAIKRLTSVRRATDLLAQQVAS